MRLMVAIMEPKCSIYNTRGLGHFSEKIHHNNLKRSDKIGFKYTVIVRASLPRDLGNATLNRYYVTDAFLDISIAALNTCRCNTKASSRVLDYSRGRNDEPLWPRHQALNKVFPCFSSSQLVI